MVKFDISYSGKIIPVHIYDWSEIISNEIRNTKIFYEIQFLECVRKDFNNGKGIIDIGANIGNHALYFSEFLEHDNLYCFEPFVDNLELLRLNLQSNKRAQIFDIALSDKDGEMPLYNSQLGNNGGFSLEQYDHSYKVLDSIKVTTLDSFNFTDISIIKIDVEAHELRVLQGGKQTILNSKPAIFIEDLHHGYPHMFAPNRFDEFFREVDYKKVHQIGLMEFWVPNN